MANLTGFTRPTPVPIPTEANRRKRPPQEPDLTGWITAGLLGATLIALHLIATV